MCLPEKFKSHMVLAYVIGQHNFRRSYDTKESPHLQSILETMTMLPLFLAHNQLHMGTNCLHTSKDS